MNRKKNYSVRVRPRLLPAKDDPANTGAKLPQEAIYVKTTKPSAGSERNPDKYVTLEIYDTGTNGPLSGDVKAFVLNIFNGTHPLLFGAIATMMEKAEEYDTLKTEGQVRLLKAPLPGLIRTAPCGFDYFRYNMVDGKEVPFAPTRKQPDGNFKAVHVTSNTVKYFLFDSQVDENDEIFLANDKVQLLAEIAAVEKWRKPSSTVTETEEGENTKPKEKTETTE